MTPDLALPLPNIFLRLFSCYDNTTPQRGEGGGGEVRERRKRGEGEGEGEGKGNAQ